VPFRSAFAQLFTQDTIIASVVFGLVVLAMAVALALGWRRRRRGQPASRRAEANRLEIGYVSVLAIVVAFLVTTGFMANARDFSDPRPAVAVRVTGYQWCWRFDYEGTPVTVDGQCQGGRPPVLVVPAGEPVRLDVTSADVVHAFWVPYLRVKTYAYPDHTGSFTVTIPRPGQWIGRCAQLCGLYHYDMDFYVRAVTPAAFRTFLRTGGR
jgi:cytochrome c oxidase subunit 2